MYGLFLYLFFYFLRYVYTHPQRWTLCSLAICLELRDPDLDKITSTYWPLGTTIMEMMNLFLRRGGKKKTHHSAGAVTCWLYVSHLNVAY